jgi:hypothetical protein
MEHESLDEREVLEATGIPSQVEHRKPPEGA